MSRRRQTTTPSMAGGTVAPPATLVPPTFSRLSTIPESPGSPTPTPMLHRRTSLEEDYFYREVMTVEKKPTEPPPSYESTVKKIQRMEKAEKAAMEAAAAEEAATAEMIATLKDKGKGKAVEAGVTRRASHLSMATSEVLPAYSCDIDLESVFQRKMEIENTIKRAEDRRWSAVVVVLRGTALEIYRCRKDRSWVGRMARGGPGVSPDRPPWLRRGALEKSYNLAYADVGIASDYLKRRYVMRVRAETDQFLLACVELETMVRWLDAFFAALSIAVPIDERDFPRDQSIPRLQRIRWYHGRDREETSQRDGQNEMERALAGEMQVPLNSESDEQPFGDVLSGHQEGSAPGGQRPGSALSVVNTTRTDDGNDTDDSDDTVSPAVVDHVPAMAGPSTGPSAPSAAPITHVATRLSTTNYPNDAVDAVTGKWQPRHRWTATHDMVYAKLCYATLQFRSPRKSNYVIMRGKQWFVDWTTGNMFRVNPPRYGEMESFGPWQVLRTEHARI